MEVFDIYVGGNFMKTSQILDVENPYKREIFAQTYKAGKEELDVAICKAKEVEREMKYLPSHKRYEILMQIAEGIRKEKDEFTRLLANEAGKPYKYAAGEVDRAAQVFVVAAEEAKRLPAEYMSLDWTPAGENKEGIIRYFPVGLIAGIAPFNFPLNLSVHKIAPAIASGNPIILKPARSTPLSVLKLAEIIHNTDLPKGAVSILPMDRQAGNQLVTDERFNMLTFTGSPEVGWKMKAEAGTKKITLELGGNAGVIIGETADIDHAVNKCVVGSFAYSGQVCIHTQRIYVHQNIFDAFAEKLVAITQKLKSGDPEDSATDISVLIDEGNAIRVEEWVNEAVNQGAKLLCGGKRENYFVEPTILTNTQSSMKVCACEIFGPVVIVESFVDFEKAIEEVNNTEFGLQSGVFTNSIKEMDYAFNELETGGVVINDVPTFRVDHMPYGGVKNSGFGREGIKFTIHEMLEPKLLVKNII